ncbi:MAG TPA: GNAT family protein [Flavitalea sp.]|nr:GNAT family protein [Flavitalea sp.]
MSDLLHGGNLNIRLASQQDVDAVFDLYMDDVANPSLTYDPMDRESFKSLYIELLPTATLFVVEMAGKVIGTFRLIPKKDRQAHTIYLGGFVVDTSMKGRGIGTEILSYIVQLVANEGKTRIELTVDTENKPAIKLYEKIGFVIEGRIRNSYKRLPENRYFDEYLMGLIL